MKVRLRSALSAAVLAASSCSGSCRTPAETGPGLAALPGAQPFPADLAARLRDATAARPPGELRTRHRAPDGSPLYTNRLVLETSPYLLQHAHNPVSFYPWGDEAFAEARRRGVTVLLSVGYSTCHWCHVMEEESFEDLQIAEALNRGYVAIKVDREERPDVDAVYMAAVQALTGSGGWPMTVWLTPDRKPFYGGTYFPSRDGARGAGKGLLTLLAELKARFDADPAGVAGAAASITAAVEASLRPAAETGLPGEEALRAAVDAYRSRFDPEHGGLRGRMKFPSSLNVRLLLRWHRRTGDADALRMATLTLEQMAAGGIYDHVGGGFHRYSTDSEWRVPHFEKMLYDNALVAIAYLEGWQATGRAEFAATARDVLRYVETEMRCGGGFCSATDADSEVPPAGRPAGPPGVAPRAASEEGRFFTWTREELSALLGAERAAAVDLGGFDGGRFVIRGPPLDADVRRALFAAREKRPRPLRDDKVIAGWNGLMISAFARAALAFGDASHARTAREAAEFVLAHLRSGGRLQRTFRAGAAHGEGMLDDHAFMVQALLDLFEATQEPRWIDEALALQEWQESRFADLAQGGYFMAPHDAAALIAREKPAYDGAEPSGNSVALINLARLYEFTGDERWRAAAETTLRAFSGAIARAPTALAEMLVAVEFLVGAPKEIVIVKPLRDSDGAEPLLARLRTAFVPDRVLAVTAEGADQASLARRVPLVQGKTAQRGRVTAYVCERRTCELPTSDPEVFASQLAKRPRLPGDRMRGRPATP